MTEAKIAIAGGNDNYCLELALANSGEGQEETNLAEALPKYGVVLLMQETSEQELIDLNKELPTDTHLITYKYPDGTVGADAVRSYSKADIFDAYHDSGLTVLSITNGFGAIKPKLFVDSAKKKS